MSAALAYDLDRASPQVMRQHHSYQQPIRDLSKHFQIASVEPSSHHQHGAETGPVSCLKVPNGMGHIVSQALWKRVGHVVTRKQLRHAIDVSDGTIDNLLAGRGEPSLRVFMALISYFGADFANEVMGHAGIQVAKPDDSARKIAEGLAELARVNPGNAGVVVDLIQQLLMQRSA